MKIIDILMEFSLTRQEASIYAALLNHGDMTGYEVAKDTGFSRSNVYSALNALVEKGAAYLVEGEATKYRPVEIKTFTELTNFTAELNMNKVYVLLDNKRYKEADEMLDIVLNSKDNVSFKVYLRAIAMKVFINVVSSSTS